MLYSCSFLSASAVEKPKIKVLPLFLLLGATQVFNVIGKPLVQNISNISTTVATNVTNTTTNIISEILKKLAALQQKENIQDSLIRELKADITRLSNNDDFYDYEYDAINSKIVSIQTGLSIIGVVVGISIILLCCSR
jgi:hypothetical protein